MLIYSWNVCFQKNNDWNLVDDVKLTSKYQSFILLPCCKAYAVLTVALGTAWFNTKRCTMLLWSHVAKQLETWTLDPKTRVQFPAEYFVKPWASFSLHVCLCRHSRINKNLVEQWMSYLWLAISTSMSTALSPGRLCWYIIL